MISKERAYIYLSLLSIIVGNMLGHMDNFLIAAFMSIAIILLGLAIGEEFVE